MLWIVVAVVVFILLLSLAVAVSFYKPSKNYTTLPQQEMCSMGINNASQYADHVVGTQKRNLAFCHPQINREPFQESDLRFLNRTSFGNIDHMTLYGYLKPNTSAKKWGIKFALKNEDIDFYFFSFFHSIPKQQTHRRFVEGCGVERMEDPKAFRQILEEISCVSDPSVADVQEKLDPVLNFIDSLQEQEQFQESLELAQQCLEILEHVLGKDDPMTIRSLFQVALSVGRGDRPEDCIPLVRECVDREQRVFGLKNEHTLDTMDIFVSVLNLYGDPEEAVTVGTQCLEIAREVLPPGHEIILSTMSSLACALVKVGKIEEALPLLVEGRQYGEEWTEILQPSRDILETLIHQIVDHASRRWRTQKKKKRARLE